MMWKMNFVLSCVVRRNSFQSISVKDASFISQLKTIKIEEILFYVDKFVSVVLGD